jgi:RNA polymerase sigma-70 factor (ECF subfamily)
MTRDDAFESLFTDLFREQANALLRYLARLSGDADVAADVTQETFVRLYERGSLPDDGRAWLVTVASNLLRDRERTTARRGQLLRQFHGDATPLAPPAPDAGLEMAETAIAIRAVRAALAKLSERDRQLLLLRHEGYSYQEIAAVVGVAVTSVGALLIRATSRLRTAYTESHAPPV